jgi:RelA/SpoT family (p)ppGpp synthetase
MTKQPSVALEDILKQMKGSQAERDLILRAHEFAVAAHEGQIRKSEEPYIQHSLAVAFLLAKLRMDAETIAAGLLHDVIEDSDASFEELDEQFGTGTAQMVDGVTKLETKLEEIDRLGRRRETERDEQELESLRKMFMAMARDARVMLIKLADRLHNMRTLHPLPPERRLAISRETMEVYAPLANRLGIWRWKGELEDLAFRWLQPATYYEIASQLAARREERELEIERHVGRLRHQLWLEEGIKAEITGRPKHIYSIYRKMRRKQIPLERVYDSRAIRVIVETIPECYHVVGVVHNLWTPIPGEFDDYIATPKENGYQSLHTAVLGMDGKTLEVQIRTRYMHRIAEYGIATHWRYKEQGRRDFLYEEQIAALRAQIEARSEEEKDPGQFVAAVTSDFFQDRVYVFTPKGKVLDLPAGSTPIDFAFHIHTEIGLRCRGAKVNGRWLPLDYALKTGDQVEIITGKRAAPSRDWLNPTLGYVRTARARSKIRQWFRRQDRDQNIVAGRTILERELKRLGFPEMSHDAVAELMGYEKLEDMLAAVGFGDVHTPHIAARVIEAKQKEKAEEAAIDEELPLVPLPDTSAPSVHVLGTGGLLTRLARCCNPIPDQTIIGYVTRGRGITIHRRDCPNALNVPDPERLIEVSWGEESRTFPVNVSVKAFNRTGLLHDISGVISREGINILNVGASRQQNPITLSFTLQITDIGQLSRLLSRIDKIPNVIEAERRTQ